MASLLVCERDVGEQTTHLRRVVVLDRRFEMLARRRRLLQLTPEPAQETDLCRAAHSGSVTVRVSPSSVTDPPSVRTTRTATAAPRSRRSSPSTTGADDLVTGVIVSIAPSTCNSTSAKCGLCQRRDPALRRLGIDVHFLSLAAHMHALLAELSRRELRELERVGRLQARLVRPALDPRGGAELVEQLVELARGGVDHLHVALLRLTEIVHTQHRPREAMDRRQRCAQVVSGERHEPRKA